MSLILKGIDMPEPIKDQYTHLELYVRSDGVVFDDDLEEVGQAIEITECNDCKYNESGYCTMWFSRVDHDGYCYKGEGKC